METLLCEVSGASRARRGLRIQSLWSGYGEIVRYFLDGGRVPSVVVKHVVPPNEARHPRGWNTSFGHERKIRSYQVECEWYRTWSPRCGPRSRVPRCHHTAREDGGWLFVLEDLDAAGFEGRRSSLDAAGVQQCLAWLADFHARFLHRAPDGLWPVGTYWHLATRPDELAALEDSALRRAAPGIDARLRGGRYRTLVHGDAKVANFCFSSADGGVAAVDFQYVGGGCGMQDVAYFFSSVLSSADCQTHAAEYLDLYFELLRETLSKAVDADALEAEWRALYPFAWADFYRFLQGWSPGHAKVHAYSRGLTEVTLETLGKNDSMPPGCRGM